MKELNLEQMQFIEGGTISPDAEACIGGAIAGFLAGGGLLGAAIGCGIGYALA